MIRTQSATDALLCTLECRFANNKGRYPGLEWRDVAALLEANPHKLRALFCERLWNRVFTFHNGAQSYFASRGLRAWFCVV